MRFELITTFEHITDYYGTIPQVPDSDVESFLFDSNDLLMLADDFVDQINDYCNVATSIYDVEYFDANTCVPLKQWLQNRLNRPCSSRLKCLYEKLLDFSIRAISLRTGVIVEL